MKIPVGEFFENIVYFLKHHLQGFFDAISTAVKAVIVFLENIFLLESHVFYPSIIVALLFGLLMGLALRKKLRARSAVIVGICACIGIGGIEAYRLNTLHQQLTIAQSEAIQQDIAGMVKSLENAAPATTQPATDAIQDFSAQVQRGSMLARQTRVAERSLRGVSPGDYQVILETLSKLRAHAQAEGMSAKQLSPLDKSIEYYESFSLIKDVEPAQRILASLDEPKACIDILNTRTYSRITGKMRVAANVFPDDAVRAATQKAQSSFATLDPVRLVWLSKALILALLALLAYVVSGLGMLVMCLIGFLLIMSMGMWDLTMLTLAMVVSATLFALILGVPLGVLAARSRSAEKVIRPVLDFMQTLPAFVYLIPAVFFFSLGVVPGAFATLIFAMPPAVRFTTLGIRQVPEEVVEAADAFGANDWQMLVKAQLPIAMPTIMAGLNQTIMLSLSMVVIVGMIGAGGLGEAVLSGIQQMEMGYGFESGLSIVILAIYLDRLTQAMGNKKKS
nr:proline/glycine betaine ABC transporter permease [Ruficoccus amylovorans]